MDPVQNSKNFVRQVHNYRPKFLKIFQIKCFLLSKYHLSLKLLTIKRIKFPILCVIGSNVLKVTKIVRKFFYEVLRIST